MGKTFPVEDGFLHQVRIGQFQPTVTRVVLDVERIEDYSVFTLPNPFRMVIDINGPPPPEVAKASAPKPPASAEARESAPEVRKVESQKPPPTVVAGAGKSVPPIEAKTSKEGSKEESAEPAEEAAKITAKTEKKETASVKPPAMSPGRGKKGEPEVSGPVSEAKPAKPSAPTEAGSRTLTRALGLKIARIVIDPGHGGHDTGTIGPTGLNEKDVVLDVGLRLKKLLESKTGAEVIMTRSDDTFIPLEERTAIANEKGADLFISIHANASWNKQARGIETYYLNFTSNPEALEVAARENSTTQESVHQLQDLIKKIALTEKIQESQDFAAQVQREVYTRLRKLTGEQKDRGTKKAPFVVLIGANMPSVLVEISFLTNPRDEHLLKKSDHREEIAKALHRGISSYVSGLGGMKVAQQASKAAEKNSPRESVDSTVSNF